MYSCNDTLAGGLPHSDIHGSTPARGSPWLFAACHVLHRLLVPRHPPNALLILDIPDPLPKERASPCTETILRHRCQAPGLGCQRQPQPEPSTAPGQSWKYLLRTQQDLPVWPHRRSLARSTTDPSGKIVHNASDHSLPNRWSACP
jgi:hypothetical protein